MAGGPDFRERPGGFWLRELCGLFLLFSMLLLILSLLSYSSADPSLNHAMSRGKVANLGGLLGAYTAGFLNDLFGSGALVLPVMLGGVAIGCLTRKLSLTWWRWLGCAMLGLWALVFAAGLDISVGELSGGGMLGSVIAQASRRLLSPFGAILFWLFFFLAGLQLFLDVSWRNMGRGLIAALSSVPVRETAGAVRSFFRRRLRREGDPEDQEEDGAEAPGLLDRLLRRVPFLRRTGTGMDGDETPAEGDAGEKAAKPVRKRRRTRAVRLGEEDIPFASSDDGDVPADRSYADQYGAKTLLPDGDEPEERAPREPRAPRNRAKPPRGGMPLLDLLPEEERQGDPAAGTDPAGEKEAGEGEDGTFPAETGAASSGTQDPPADENDPSAEERAFLLGGTDGDLSGATEEDPGPQAGNGAPRAPRERKGGADLRSGASGRGNRASGSGEKERPSQPSEGSQLPPLSLLCRPEPGDDAAEEEGEDCSEALMSCLSDFHIQAELVQVIRGPVVTTYMLLPARGVPVRVFTSHTEDIARALWTVSVFIQAPVPHTNTVGIVIPNKKRSLVNFREIAESEAFRETDAALPVIVGRDTTGRPFVADLALMPHLLVAGATGQGKSVCLNALLTSLLLRRGPDELKLLLVDPKRVEMSLYENEPHLIHPVVKEVSDAASALLWALQEMQQRLHQIERLNVRNIAGYNALLASYGDRIPPEFSDCRPMPYIVIVIDELADLMMQAKKDVEPALARLAQMARACGIHLIIATQRPSVDVVTGLIKANFPCRICFRVSSQQDSRTTLGLSGAEKLLGKGDMFYVPNGGTMIRLHGPFLREEEVQSVVGFWKKRGRPTYELDFASWNGGKPEEPGGRRGALLDDDDPLYLEVLEFIKETGQVSTSLLQRRFKIGYNKAARYMERLDAEGLVGPSPAPGKPRPVIGL